MDIKVTHPPRDWRDTLFLPATEFPMKAGLPALEERLLARWRDTKLYERLRAAREAAKAEKFILHDGPPYANGSIHIGHTLNKTLKDMVVRSRSMMGLDAPYVPGFDCHGLPIEWKIEEELRAAGRAKGDIPVAEFRALCREFAAKWIGVQTEEFQRLGVMGAWDRPYLTMDYDAEATIAAELCRFAMNGTLYRGSKPVMWSVVEGTALAEAEVEYKEIVSPAIYVKFPVARDASATRDNALPADPETAERFPGYGAATYDTLPHGLPANTSVVIWTTTPWTLPSNRAIAFSSSVEYGLYKVTPGEGSRLQPGEHLILATKLVDQVAAAAKAKLMLAKLPTPDASFVQYDWLIPAAQLDGLVTCHPLRPREGRADVYDFPVRLYAGDFVTADAGTGFVHIAPGHGQDDYGLFVGNRGSFVNDGIASVPHTVGPDGRYFADVPLFGGLPVQDARGRFGKFDDTSYANGAVIAALREAGALLAEPAAYTHSYPHSWRSKAPVIFRNTPQWFIALDRTLPKRGRDPDGNMPLGDVFGKGDRSADTIRGLAAEAVCPPGSSLNSEGRERYDSLEAQGVPVDEIERQTADYLRSDPPKAAFTPEAGRRRLQGFVVNRPDWVVSRQRAWGVPLTLFTHGTSQLMLPGTSQGTGAMASRFDGIDSAAAALAGDEPPNERVAARSAELAARVTAAFRAQGADAWFAPGARERFLGRFDAPGDIAAATAAELSDTVGHGRPLAANPAEWEAVTDILDVWFDSGCTHAFVLESGRWPELLRVGSQPGKPPADPPADLYLEGSDQHRGWFQSSLLESVGTRGRAPYRGVLTHGFILDEKGEAKMSKSKGNALSPMAIAETQGAEILRLWVASSDYTGDIRFGPGLLVAATENYRRIRNMLRFLLGNLAHYGGVDGRNAGQSNGLERWMCHRLAQVDDEMRAAYDAYDFPRVFRTLIEFCTNDLSATYFDIRKDALYCEPADSPLRHEVLAVLDAIFERLVRWLAPIMVFTAEEAFLARHGAADDAASVHLTQFLPPRPEWRDEALGARWEAIWRIRRVVTGALEVERAGRRIGAGLEAAVTVHVADAALAAMARDAGSWAELTITSAAALVQGDGPADAFRLADVPGVAVSVVRADSLGFVKCARSWRWFDPATADREFPDLTPRDAAAVRAFDARHAAA